jgi:hypothetical protein
MDTKKRPFQAYVEDDDSDSDVPLKQTQEKRLRRSHNPIPACITPHPPRQTSQPALIRQVQCGTQQSHTALPSKQSQRPARQPVQSIRRLRPAPAPASYSLPPATGTINTPNRAAQTSQSLPAVSELRTSLPTQNLPLATAAANTQPIHGIAPNRPESRWPPLPNDIPDAFLFYAEEICSAVNVLCRTQVTQKQFSQLLRHENSASSVKPVWTVPDISKQQNVGFLCGKYTSTPL